VSELVPYGGIGIITEDAINRQRILEEIWLFFTPLSKLLKGRTKQKQINPERSEV
jgi:hypothetical protein